MNLSSIIRPYSANTLLALKNINWMLLEKLISVPVSLLLHVVLARYLGTEVYGQYSYYTALITIVVPITALGLNAIVAREVVQKSSQAPQIIGTSLLGRLLGCFAGLFGLVFYAFCQDSYDSSLIVYLAFCQIFSAFTVLNFWFQANQLNKFEVFARLWTILIGVIIKFTVVFADLGLRYLLLAYGLDFLLGAMFLSIYYRRQSQSTTLPINFGYLQEIMSQSKWLLMASVAATINFRIDLIMLGNLSTDYELGLYSLAARISEVWYSVPLAVTAAFFPVLLKARGKSKQDYWRKLQKLNDVLFAMSLAVVLPAILMSEFFVRLIFGEQYSGTAAMLNIHIVGAVFIFMRALLNKWLIAENLLKFSLISQGTGALINLACNYLLIPEFGGKGAAVASVISYGASSYLALFAIPETRPMARVVTLSMFYPWRLFSAFSK